jgi:hypothetical protein
MTNVIPNFQMRHDVQYGYKDVTATSGFSPDLTKFLYSLPTLNVSGSTANNGAVTVSFANIVCVNFIGGVRVATIQSASLATQTAYVLANTSGSYSLNLQLDNGGTIGGLSIFPLNSGNIVQFQFNGTNLF